MAFNSIAFNRSSGVGEGLNAAAQNFLRAYQMGKERRLQEQQAATQQQQAQIQTQAMQREAAMAPLREAMIRGQAFQAGVKPAEQASDTQFDLPTMPGTPGTMGLSSLPALTIAKDKRYVPLGGGTLPLSQVSDATQASVPEQGGFVYDTMDNPLSRARVERADERDAQSQQTRDAALLQLQRLYAGQEFTAGQNALNRQNRLDAAGARAQTAGGAGPNWQTVPTPQGYVQVNPKTGETRSVSEPAPVGAAPSAASGGQLQPRDAGSIRQKVAGNRVQLRTIDDAIAKLRAHPQAIGLVRAIPFVGDAVNQRMDEEGVAARAAVANIGSLTFHTRSGSAVTASEAPRLQPFVPGMGDKSGPAIVKLQQLRAAIVAETDALEQSEPAGGGDAAAQGSTAPATADQPAPRRTINQSQYNAARAKGSSDQEIALLYDIDPTVKRKQ